MMEFREFIMKYDGDLVLITTAIGFCVGWILLNFLVFGWYDEYEE